MKVCSSTDCDYTWRASDCSETLPFICELDFQCKQGWVSFGNSCYKLEKETARTSYAAQSHCLMNYDVDIFVPNSNEEAAFVASYVNGKGVSNIPFLISRNGSHEGND